jgi:hypothetical protein
VIASRPRIQPSGLTRPVGFDCTEPDGRFGHGATKTSRVYCAQAQRFQRRSVQTTLTVVAERSSAWSRKGPKTRRRRQRLRTSGLPPQAERFGTVAQPRSRSSSLEEELAQQLAGLQREARARALARVAHGRPGTDELVALADAAERQT